MKLIIPRKNPFIHLLGYCFAITVLSGPVLAESDQNEYEEISEEGHIALSQEQIDYSEISLAVATAGTIRDVLPVYGFVAGNAERVQSVKARFDGTIHSVNKSVGDPVLKGETLLTVEANESLKTYAITASLNGIITQRNANVGEQTANLSLLIIQDFSTVWVELSIFPKDVALVKLNQPVRILSLDSYYSADGEIIYIASKSDNDSQAISARALIDNPKGIWKVGAFINAQVTLSETLIPVTVRNTAIQIIENKPAVFVQGNAGFESRFVTLGRTDGELSEILSGLDSDEVYVAKNSFVLKSELSKEDAEHGH